jgi:hypothetical protein
LAEIFGVTEEQAKQVKANTVGEMISYMHFYRTKEPTNVEEAIKSIQ